MSKQAMMKHWYYKREAGFDLICGICDQPISKGGDKGKGALTVDHIIPKSLGGTNENANLQPAHSVCNRRRSNTVLHLFKDKMKDQETILKRALELIDKYEIKEQS